MKHTLDTECMCNVLQHYTCYVEIVSQLGSSSLSDIDTNKSNHPLGKLQKWTFLLGAYKWNFVKSLLS